MKMKSEMDPRWIIYEKSVTISDVDKHEVMKMLIRSHKADAVCFQEKMKKIRCS